jgi:alpha-N-acetylglucosaminidase
MPPLHTAALPALLGLLGLLQLAGAADDVASVSVQPALDLVTRNFGPDAAAVFILSIKAGEDCGEAAKAPCFSLSQSNGKVSITGTSMSELTYGIGYYTRYTCGLTVGRDKWGGSHTNASSWPCTPTLKPVQMPRAVPYTYQDNVCTHSYSYVWYGEEEWTEHIDEMALRGINVFYAITGQEEIQYQTFLQFGLTDLQIREFFNGPAYLTWSRGQSMQTVGTGKSVNSVNGNLGSGLPRSWMQAQHALQKKILKQTRALGIIGVLPAFQGNMPPQIKTLKPEANISTTHDPELGSEGNCAWVAGSDPLFAAVADAWMKIMIADFGTDHWYQCDGFL